MSDDPEGADPILSMEQFAALLREKAQTGMISCSMRVSSEGIDGEEDEMCAGIAGRVWEATGFRFTYDRVPFEFEDNC